MQEIEFFDLRTKESPRTILEADFPRLGSLPIKGGWGYDRSTACIIDRNDPTVPKSVPFDGVGLEYVFAEYRLYEELIVFRPEGEKYSGIRRKLIDQRTFHADTGHYDILRFQVSAFKDQDCKYLKSIYEGPNGASSPNFDHAAHDRLHKSLICVGEREYWFEISTFFGK